LDNKITDIESLADVVYTLHNANDLIIKDFKRVGNNNTSDSADHESEYLSRATPVFNDDKCIHCKKCIEICPANALKMENGKVTIDKDACIRCYCCNEVCPVNAISISH
jgi:NAD-dependent dihydropyrimidine dehydrogenase PreA subunit